MNLYYLLNLMFSITRKNTGKMEKKLLEKSENFVGPQKWEPWQFNQSDIASHIAALMLMLSVNGSSSGRSSGSLCMLFAFKLFHSYEYCIQYIHNPSASCYF